MKVPFSWRPTGWFQVAWSGEVGQGEVKPMKYFGQELVAYHDDHGEVHVLNAHCPHLGAHLGFGGKVSGDCVVCPYHGWGFGPDGVNRFIPYEDRPNTSHPIRSWPTKEINECIFVWNHPKGAPPAWDLPSVFDAFPEEPANPDDYYRSYPELAAVWRNEPLHPQIPMENAPDGIHFRYVHAATVDPVLLNFEVGEEDFRTRTGWPAPAGDGSQMALTLDSVNYGVGGTYSIFTGANSYRLALFTTPVDFTCSDMYFSIWWPKQDGGTGDVVPDKTRQFVERQYLNTPEEDFMIWRHQVYVENPALAKRDARPYGALRKWARRFYDEPPQDWPPPEF